MTPAHFGSFARSSDRQLKLKLQGQLDRPGAANLIQSAETSTAQIAVIETLR